jgi:hypothetical protein
MGGRLQNTPKSAEIVRVDQKEEEYVRGWSLINLFLNLKV